MPTEDDARRLLAKAAATIDVDDSAPMTLTGLPEPRRRHWPVLAAAAAVVLAIGGGYLVSRQLGDDPQPEPPPADTDREPVEQEHVYADDEMPSLLGYTEDEATTLLSRRGYALQITAEHSCDQPAGYVLGTGPGPGTPMTAGDEVRVRVTRGPPPTGSCVKPALQRQEVWQQVFDLARFARGLGPAPSFPEELSIAAGEGEYVALTTAEAADPDNWVLCDDGECHSALAALEQILTEPVPMDRYFPSTYIVVTDNLAIPSVSPEPLCLTPDPSAGLDVLRYHPTSYVYADYPMDGARFCPPPPVLQIEWTKDHQLAAVRLRLALEAPEPEAPVRPTAEQEKAADAFVAWARGEGPAPEFAPQVHRLLSGSEWPPLISRPDVPARWRTSCPRFMSAPCPRSAIDVLRDYEGPVAQSATLAAGCVARPGQLPDALKVAAATDLVRLDQPEAKNCSDSWSVELWIDDEGRIYAVNTSAPYL